MSAEIPVSDSLVLIRTYFGDQHRWQELLRIARNQPEPFTAHFEVVDDIAFRDKSADAIMDKLPEGYAHAAFFLADQRAILEEDHPCLIVGPLGEEARPFRAFARELAGIDSNLSIANMDFDEFADAAGEDGVFRGFE